MGCANYYNRARTYLLLTKNGPIQRSILSRGAIKSRPFLSGLHHEYARRVKRNGQAKVRSPMLVILVWISPHTPKLTGSLIRCAEGRRLGPPCNFNGYMLGK
jgi:hypothetical protein